MERLADLLLAFLDVIKADLARSKEGIFDVGLSLGLTFAAVVFFIPAIALIAYALFLVLAEPLGRPVALCLTGLFFFLSGGAFLWIARRHAN